MELSSLKNPKTLVILVDDNKDYLEMAKALIEVRGYPVMVFSDPYEALKFVIDGLERPAICLIDYDMGKDVYTGIQLIKHINNIKTQAVVCFLVTAHDDHKLFVEALKYDAFGYFSKLPKEGGREFNLGDLYVAHLERAERFILNELMLAERLDALTGVYGVYDREGGRQKFRQIWNIARKSRLPTSAIFVDVNGLKSVNEKYGEEYGYGPGDKVIQALAKGLQLHRTTDIVIRFGGDEFLVILQKTKRAQAQMALTRLKAELSQVEVEILPGVMFKLTVSGGVYSISGVVLDRESPDSIYAELIEWAGKGERKNKKKERRKNCSADPG